MSAREDTLRAALKAARNWIDKERSFFLGCHTLPDATTGEPDMSTFDDEDRPYLEDFDAILTRIDAALKPGAEPPPMRAEKTGWDG